MTYNDDTHNVLSMYIPFDIVALFDICLILSIFTPASYNHSHKCLYNVDKYIPYGKLPKNNVVTCDIGFGYDVCCLISIPKIDMAGDNARCTACADEK